MNRPWVQALAMNKALNQQPGDAATASLKEGS
jgi:heme exporter protein C